MCAPYTISCDLSCVKIDFVFRWYHCLMQLLIKLLMHLDKLLFCRTTMYTEFTVLQRIHSDMEEGLVLNAFKYNHFRCAWYSFLSLLDISYSENFSCSICGNRPQTLIMDATSVSFRQALDSWRPLLGVLPGRREKHGR